MSEMENLVGSRLCALRVILRSHGFVRPTGQVGASHRQAPYRPYRPRSVATCCSRAHTAHVCLGSDTTSRGGPSVDGSGRSEDAERQKTLPLLAKCAEATVGARLDSVGVLATIKRRLESCHSADCTRKAVASTRSMCDSCLHIQPFILPNDIRTASARPGSSSQSDKSYVVFPLQRRSERGMKRSCGCTRWEENDEGRNELVFLRRLYIGRDPMAVAEWKPNSNELVFLRRLYMGRDPMVVAEWEPNSAGMNMLPDHENTVNPCH